MNCFVTGGSGFIGANLIHELAARGHRVKALLRPNSDRRGLAGANYEVVEGDVLEQASLQRGLKNCDWCFHVAASYHLWLRDYAPMYAANVEGTRNVIEAAGAAGLWIFLTGKGGGLWVAPKVGGKGGSTGGNKPGFQGGKGKPLKGP